MLATKGVIETYLYQFAGKQGIDMEVKRLSFPTRCEICHQADRFDATRNWCERCEEMKLQNEEYARMQRRRPNILTILLCKLGLHHWSYSRWERSCLSCDTVQHVWRILGRTIEWRTEPVLADGISINAEFIESLPLPLRPWHCVHCSRSVMRVHPPGYFERCPHCGKQDYVAREDKESFGH